MPEPPHVGFLTPPLRGQISADRFVTPVRVYVVKNADGTPKRDPVTKQLVTDVIVRQRLLPKGRKHDDLRLEYDVSAACVHLQKITRLLKAKHNGQIPAVPYDPFHSKAEHLGPERYLFRWNGRHLRNRRGACLDSVQGLHSTPKWPADLPPRAA
jgi:hypothetical protein